MKRACFDVPSDIVECATKLRTYFDERNIKDWALDGVCALPQPAVEIRQLVPYEWTKADADRAYREGWVLSPRDDGFLEIQKRDATDIFESDVAAQAFVHERAMPGTFRRRAWDLHATRWYK